MAEGARTLSTRRAPAPAEAQRRATPPKRKSAAGPGNGRIARGQKAAAKQERSGGKAAGDKGAGDKGAGDNKRPARKSPKQTKESAKEQDAGKAGAADGDGGVTLKLPPPPKDLTPAAKVRLKDTTKVVTDQAAEQKTLPDADTHVSAARKGFDEPKQAVQAEANKADMSAKAKIEPPNPKIVALCAQIDLRVHSSDLEDLLEYARKELAKNVEADTQTVTDAYKDVDKEPKPARDPNKAETIIKPDVVKPVDAKAEGAIPDPIPDAKLSPDADLKDADKRIDDAGLNKETAKLVNTGVIADIRRERGDLDTISQEDAERLKQEQKDILARRAEEQKKLDEAASTTLATARMTSVVANFDKQSTMAQSEQTTMTLFTTAANEIVTTARNAVTAKLTKLKTDVDTMWAEATKPAGEISKYVDNLGKVIDERYSGVGGTLLSVGESIVGFFGADTAKDRLKRELTAAKVDYARIVCEGAKKVSSHIETEIKACKTLIDTAHTLIDGMISSLPTSLQTWAEGQKGVFDKQLNELGTTVDSTRDQLTAQLMLNAVESVNDIMQKVNALREKMKSVIDKIAEFIGDFLDDPVKAIINGLLDIVGIPRSTFWRLVDKFSQVVSDIADDPKKFANNLMKALEKGFGQFFDNIGTHLLKGFLNWLFGKLKDVNVTVPKDFSVNSVVGLFLEVMGITWARIRKLLVKHVGEKNVALVEKAFEMIKLLIDQGPSGIVEMIKEKLDPKGIFDTVLEAAVQYVIETLIKKVTVRIIAMLNPVGAILQAIEAIYRVVKWVIENAAKIFKLVEVIVDGAIDIMKGNIGGMANAIETVLAGLIPPVIDFFAGFLGLGDLPNKVAEIIGKLQSKVESILDDVIGFIVKKAKDLLAKLGIGGNDENGSNDWWHVKKGYTSSKDKSSHSAEITKKGKKVAIIVRSVTPLTLEQLAAQFDALTPEERKAAGGEGRTLLNELSDIQKIIDANEQPKDEEATKQAQAKVTKDLDDIIGLLGRAGLPRGLSVEQTKVFWVTKKGGTERAHRVVADPLTHIAGNTTGGPADGVLQQKPMLDLWLKKTVTYRHKGTQQVPMITSLVGAHLLHHGLHGPKDSWNIANATRSVNGDMLNNPETFALDAKAESMKDKPAKGAVVMPLRYETIVTYFEDEPPPAKASTTGTVANDGEINKWVGYFVARTVTVKVSWNQKESGGFEESKTYGPYHGALPPLATEPDPVPSLMSSSSRRLEKDGDNPLIKERAVAWIVANRQLLGSWDAMKAYLTTNALSSDVEEKDLVHKNVNVARDNVEAIDKLIREDKLTA